MTTPTYGPDEILRLTGLTRRTLHYYVEIGLLPGATPRGVGTVYTHEQLGRLLAIKHLRDTEQLKLAHIKKRLNAMSPAEIEAMIAPPAPTPPPPAPPPLLPPALPAPLVERALPGAVRWEHIELLPGLELRLRADAGHVLRRLALEIHARYAATASLEEARALEEPPPMPASEQPSG